MSAEKPILFSAAMVRAILQGRKTQTRRVIKRQPLNPVGPNYDGLWSDTIDPVTRYFACGQLGDRLWVRETFYNDLPESQDLAHVYYRADGECCEQIPECQCFDVGKPKWTPSIHMPRWASRLTLEITGIRVERVKDISNADCFAEGLPPEETKCNVTWFADLWDSLNPKHAWDKNPWVWVITFKPVPTLNS